jgi:predicted small secreted protein
MKKIIVLLFCLILVTLCLASCDLSAIMGGGNQSEGEGQGEGEGNNDGTGADPNKIF